jgi:diketogulonate reductase-like aldo/keto reductase
MATKKIPEVVVNSWKKMPTIGFGTGTTPPQQTLLHAIEIGYRHFDTASLYNTEEPLGQAVSKALDAHHDPLQHFRPTATPKCWDVKKLFS